MQGIVLLGVFLRKLSGLHRTLQFSPNVFEMRFASVVTGVRFLPGLLTVPDFAADRMQFLLSFLARHIARLNGTPNPGFKGSILRHPLIVMFAFGVFALALGADG